VTKATSINSPIATTPTTSKTENTNAADMPGV
jgi:hypothetical protein